MATISKIKPVVFGESNFTAIHPVSVTHKSLWSNFNEWCLSLENYRYMILAIMVIVQGCIVVPGTLVPILMTPSVITPAGVLFAAIATMGVMVTNISISPMKAIVLTFLFNVLLMVSVVGIHFAII